MIRLRNKQGAIIEIDGVQSRISRLQKRVYAWAKTIDQSNGMQDMEYIMITLTYRGVDDWKPKHIRDFMLKMRKRFTGILCYAWVAELQQRGAVHYHVMVGIRPGSSFYTYKSQKTPENKGFTVRGVGFPDDIGDWPHGMTKVEKARTRFYLVKYTGKEYQKVGKFPKGLRMFAVWISKGLLSDLELWLFRLSTFPRWVNDAVLLNADIIKNLFKICRVNRGVLAGGYFLKSPWTVVNIIKEFQV